MKKLRYNVYSNINDKEYLILLEDLFKIKPSMLTAIDIYENWNKEEILNSGENRFNLKRGRNSNNKVGIQENAYNVTS